MMTSWWSLRFWISDDDLVVVQITEPRVVLAFAGDLRGATDVRTRTDPNPVADAGWTEHDGEGSDDDVGAELDAGSDEG